MKFKIHADDVRCAAKKSKLEVTNGTWGNEIEDDNIVGESCPLGCLVKAKYPNLPLEEEVLVERARKIYGRHFVAGFVNGVDGYYIDISKPEEIKDEDLRVKTKRDVEQFQAGYRNGTHIKRVLEL